MTLHFAQDQQLNILDESLEVASRRIEVCKDTLESAKDPVQKADAERQCKIAKRGNLSQLSSCRLIFHFTPDSSLVDFEIVTALQQSHGQLLSMQYADVVVPPKESNFPVKNSNSVRLLHADFFCKTLSHACG